MKELIVMSLRGSTYGVWKEDVLSVRDVNLIHGLPMTPQWYCGVSEIDGRTANIFDLAVCMGHSPYDRRRPGRVLLMSEKGKPEGFVFEEQTGRLEVSPEEVFPMPAYLHSPEVGTCVVTSGELIPVIDIVPLYKRIRQSGWGPTAFSFTGAMQRMRLSPETAFRVFEICGQAFAVQEDLVDGKAASPGRVCAFPLAPPHMKGVAFQSGEVRAVLNLADYMELSGDPGHSLALLQKQGGPALLVDSDAGSLGGEVNYRPMPPLAASGLMQYALLREGEVIPLLHIPAMISRNPEKGVKKKYTPRSKFHELFGKKEAKVLEFFLPGMSYSLPDSQVEDVVGLKPYRELRGMHPMMRGVAEHEGEVLPVLDLAVCFGRNTHDGEDPRMVVLKNGNFRVLLLTEGVAGRRLLSREEQRELPINLPHRYVYGCYTRENTVRLILDVETLTTHFDQRLVSEYFDTLAREMALDGLLDEAGGDETNTVSAVLEEVRDRAEEEEDEAVRAVTTFEEAEAGLESHVAFAAGARADSEDDAFESVGEEVDAHGEADETTPVEGESLQDDAVGKEAQQEDEFEELEDEVSFAGAAVEDEVSFAGAAVTEERAGLEEDAPVLETPETEETMIEKSDREVEQEVSEEVAETESEPGGTEDEVAFPDIAGTTGIAGMEGVGEGEPEFETIKTEEASAWEGGAHAEEREEEGPEEDTGAGHELEEARGEDGIPGPTGLADEAEEDLDSGSDTTETEETADGEEDTKEDYSGEDAVPERETEESTPVYVGPDGKSDMDAGPSDAEGPDTHFEEPASTTQEAFDAGETVVFRDDFPGDRENLSEDVTSTAGGDVSIAGASGLHGTVDGGESPRTRPSEEAESGHGEKGTVPEPAQEYLKASSENGGKSRAAYAVIILLLVVAAYFAFVREGSDTEVALRDEITAGEGEEAVPAQDLTGSEDGEEGIPPEYFETGALEAEYAGSGIPEPENFVTEATDTEAIETTVLENDALETATVETEADYTQAVKAESVEADILVTTEVREKAPSPPAPSVSSEKKTSVLLMELEPKRGEISLSLYQAEPSDPGIYVVVRGDTLWHISRRFTGNPFNYPRLARDSGIENPDLIFPGQRILIRIKGEEGQPLPP